MQKIIKKVNNTKKVDIKKDSEFTPRKKKEYYERRTKTNIFNLILNNLGKNVIWLILFTIDKLIKNYLILQKVIKNNIIESLY